MRGLRHRYHAGGLPQLQHFPQLQAHVEHVSHDAIQLICTVLQEPEANAIQTVNLLHLSLLQVVPHLKCCKGQGCGVREGCKMKFSEQKWVRDGWELSSLGKKSRRLLKMRGVAAGETREWWVTDYICRRTVSAYSSTVNLLQPGHLVCHWKLSSDFLTPLFSPSLIFLLSSSLFPDPNSLFFFSWRAIVSGLMPVLQNIGPSWGAQSCQHRDFPTWWSWNCPSECLWSPQTILSLWIS